MDILTIGHCTIDLHIKIPSNKVSTLSAKDDKVCFYHGSKIEAEDFEISPGGNALNVAVGTGRLGLKSAIYTELGDDEYSEPIIKRLKDYRVNTDLCVKNKGTHNNISAIIIYASERTIFSYHQKQTYYYRKWGAPKIIYYTSMPEGYESFQKNLIQYLMQNPKTMVAFNPGTVQLKGGVETFKSILGVTDILFVNKEEAMKLTKITTPDVPLDKLHKYLQDLGPKMTVITDGRAGASASAGNAVIRVRAYTDKRPIADKTGAGDAFSSGFLAAINYNKSLRDALLWGAINSGNIIKEPGPHRGLLTRSQIEEIVRNL